MGLTEFITAIAAAGGALAAFEALKTWKKQLRGNKAHEIAWRYLEATINLREAINYGVRNPFISLGEFQQAAEEYYGKDRVEQAKKDDSRAETIAVYAIRWKEIDQARKQLRTAKVQAEVWWGEQIRNLDKPINELIGRLYVNVKNLLDPDRELRADHDIIYFAADHVTEFDTNLNSAVKEIDDWMRPYIHYEDKRVEKVQGD